MLLSTGLSFLGEIRNRKQAKGMAGEDGEWVTMKENLMIFVFLK